MSKIDRSLLAKWCDEELDDQIAWHKARNPQLTDARLDDYRAGFQQGWHKAFAHLKLHGWLK
jgi:hypothetical protein